MQFTNLQKLAARHMDGLKDAWAKASPEAEDIPSDYQRLDGISLAVLGQLNALQGKRVLDIGCNSGLYSIMAGVVADHVIGCDINSTYIKRAEAGRAHLHVAQQNLDHVRFVNSDFPSLLNNDINALIVARVLYHLGDEKISLLSHFIRSNVSTIVIQARPMRDIIYKDHPKWKIANTTVYNGLYKVEDCVRFVSDGGFDEVSISSLQPLWKDGESFPVIVGNKRSLTK